MFRRPSLVLRSLRARPSRTILTIFGIVLGVAVILAIRIANQSTLDSLTSLFTETSGNADLVIINPDNDEDGFYEDALRRIAHFPGVTAAIPSVQAQTVLVDEISPEEVEFSFLGASGRQLILFGIDPILDPLAREYNLVAGGFLSKNLNAFDVVLVQEFAEDQDVWLKDRIDIVTPEGFETLRIVGIISKDGAGTLNNGAFGVIPLKVAQKIFDSAGKLDQIDIVASEEAESGTELDALKQALQERLGKKYSVIYPATQGKKVTQMMDMYQFGLSFFSVIALFVGTFLIYNAFSMTVVERTREIGMMRTLGMTRSQIMKQILTEAVILGVLGSAIGVGLGIVMSRGLIRMMEVLVGTEVKEISVPTDALVISVVIGIIVTLVAAILPARAAGNISPLEALRIRGNPREGWVVRRGWILGLILVFISYLILNFNPFPQDVAEQASMSTIFLLFIGATLLIPITVNAWEFIVRPVVRVIYGGEGQIGSSNIQRSKMRTTLTVAALMIGVAMLLSIRAMTDAFKYDIQDWMDSYMGGDLYVFSSIPMRLKLGGQLNAVEGVAAATPNRYLDIIHTTPEGEKEDIAFMALEPQTYTDVASFVFAADQGDPENLMKRLAAGDAVFIASTVSEKHGLYQGDTIRLQTRSGQKDFEVAAVVTDFYNQGNVVEGSYRDMRRYFGVNDVSSFLVKIEPGYTVEEVKARIDRIYGKRRNLTIESNEALKERALGLTTQSFSLFEVVSIIGMIVAALGVVNTLIMNVMERTQEIGMLRGVGMTRGQVSKMILAEAGMMGVIGGAFGIAFGIFLSRMFLVSVSTMQGYTLTYILPVAGIFIGLTISLVISQLAAIWPARRASSINIIEAIQYE